MPFDYTSGNPDNLVGGGPARMQDVQGPFYDIRAWLNSASGGGGGGGSAVPVLTAAPILDVGLLNQRRAGRQLTNADFTSLGLGVPIALWNLGDLTDVSGNGRVLANKGAVPFGVGINGIATTAAVFSGSTGQALYLPDGAASDALRVRALSWGCWFRTAKRGTGQDLFTRATAVLTNGNFRTIVLSNAFEVGVGYTAAAFSSGSTADREYALGVSDVADDRWHFGVGTFDGSCLRAYVDGALEAAVNTIGVPMGSFGCPTNIGAYGADASAAAGAPHYGRVDEAFVTADVLTEDQVRCLYAAKFTHTLTSVPTGVRVNVHRRRKGAALVAADFTTQPLRLHNFTAGALTDEGSGGQALINNGVAVSVSGADGTVGNAFSFAGAQSLSATDAGLPAGTASRSYGCWFKTTAVTGTVMGWGGALGVNDVRITVAAGIAAWSGADGITGPFVSDGQWHLAIVTEDNAAGDGVRRKLYLDGRLAGGSTVLTSLTLAGAGAFKVGTNPTGVSAFFTGQIDGAFVCGYAMAQDEITRLYSKSSQDLGASPKNAGDHVERVDASSVLFIGDTLDSQHTVDVGVMA